MSTPAAVVQTWGHPPTYSAISLPSPPPSHHRVKVLSAAVHPLVRSRASGTHFSVAGLSPPHVPGADGVGLLPDTNQPVYFSALLSPTGSLAHEINVRTQDTFPLPPAADPDTIAVLTNPALSSWMALTARAGIKTGTPGVKIGIVGATGVSGQAAVQIGRAFGASEVVAIGKPGPKLEKTRELGASAIVPLAESLADTDFSAAADVDVVLDYLWGDVSEAAFRGIVEARRDPGKRLAWVEIGALAGEGRGMQASLLRKANVVVMGCGPGSWSFQELGEQVPGMLEAVVRAGLRVEYEGKRLEDVEGWWGEEGGKRVLVKM